ncbi:hypothetical protein PG994_008444 [Apiospora phragmitis]|uniref:Uncharacterized protein n=1 Tax=Apiospora phragmitis TaxID=2905665 RepID=A0ABR1UIS3_9PEZI
MGQNPTQPQPQPQYPGLGLDLRHYAIGQHWKDNKPCYPIGVCENAPGATSDLFQLREVFMLAVMDRLTDKPDWDRKVFDDAIAAKWRAEALSQPEEGLYRLATEHVNLNRNETLEDSKLSPLKRTRYLSEKAFDYCIKELRIKAQHFQKTGLVLTLDAVGNCVAKSDVLVGSELKQELVAAFDRLRADQVAKGGVDWHPRSNDMVQDIVHPSLYCLVWGKSHFHQDEAVGTTDAVTKWAGKGEPTPDQGESPTPPSDRRYRGNSTGVADHYWSTTYQWLPANLAFRNDGTTEFTSYINNLHPARHADVYRIIEKLVDRAIPAWEQCIADFQPANRAERRVGRKEPRISPAKYADDRETEGLWEELNTDILAKLNVQLDKDTVYELIDDLGAELSDDEEMLDEDLENDVEGVPQTLLDKLPREAVEGEKWKQVREPILLEPDGFTDVGYAACERLRDKFGDSGLQVIVKMASIELTPEKPEFSTGSWHIEGQMNEHICATALYYLDSDNVTPSSLAFRMGTSWNQWDLQMSAGQDAYHWLERSYGASFGPSGGGGPCLQFYGSVETPEGRLLAFPNVFQHRVSFRLQDPTKPGHRRFIALWLVDPHQRIVSTANVPPQQLDWWAEAVFQGIGDSSSNRSSNTGEMPPEVLQLLREGKKEELTAMIPPESRRQQQQNSRSINDQDNNDGDEEEAGIKATKTTSRLPPEVVDMVRQNGVVPEGLMSREEARAHRLKLMDERSQFDQSAEQDWFSGDYNFCEH